MRSGATENYQKIFSQPHFTSNPHCETVSFFINSMKTRVLFIGSFVVLVVRVNVVCVESVQKNLNLSKKFGGKFKLSNSMLRLILMFFL